MTVVPPSSPCIRVCVLDAAARLCIGCGRTLDEIAAWSGMSEEERAATERLLPARLDALGGAGADGEAAR